ncbi:MAG TPA: YiiD C-terminal domain-containing protein [Deltaproteobacteria bacterium]|nr:YiiD C-terminal domain-containing protein [Deltaproteobacteria bacterium]
MIDEKYKDAPALIAEAVHVIHETGLEIVGLRDRYAKLVMPLKPNLNHIGIMYAGSLFILAECSGGILWYVSFDIKRFYPIVKEISVKYKRPATTDVTLEVQLSEEEARAMQEETDRVGKKDWVMDLELKDTEGQVCCVVHGTWQLRKYPEQNQ